MSHIIHSHHFKVEDSEYHLVIKNNMELIVYSLPDNYHLVSFELSKGKQSAFYQDNYWNGKSVYFRHIRAYLTNYVEKFDQYWIFL